MKRIVLIPVVLILAWFAFSTVRSLSTAKAPVNAGDEPVEQVKHVTSAPATLAGVPAKKPNVVSTKGSPTMSRPFAFEHELAEYLGLQEKVILTSEEKAQKSELLRHAGLLRALGPRLLSPVPVRKIDAIREQDAALDLLLEALRSGDSAVASEVLQTVVQDSQVEDVHLEKAVREQMAGLKAEVLYQWSALTPDMAANLQTWLPGPVSQKIWANVLKMQQSNLAESAAEVRAMSH